MKWFPFKTRFAKTAPASPEAIEELTEYMRQRLVEGFLSSDEVLQQVIEDVTHEHPGEDLAPAASALLPQLLAERATEQRSWPAVTDCDRLDAAFEELNSMGIMARHDWTCCSNCAAAEMPFEFKRLRGRWQGVPIIGYVCYHHQETEAAACGGGLFLGFGSTERATSEADFHARSVEVAQAVCDVLGKHGLPVSWNKTVQEKIGVQLNWQRRARPARFCHNDTSR